MRNLRAAFTYVVLQVSFAGWSACDDVRREPISGPGPATSADARSAAEGGMMHPKCTNTDCPASAPVCNAASGICSGCLSDADCPSVAPRCDAVSGGCVECKDPADCPRINCASAPSCPEAIRCHPTQHRCVECVTDGHCNSVGERCSSALGVCATPCTTAAVCPADESICDTVVGFCVGCVRDTDCGSSAPYCRRSECTR